MVQINFARREVNCKVVYYGPGLSGKTTNLELIHKKAGQGVAGSVDRSRRRQVTVIEREAWDRFMKELDADISPSSRRANLMVSGVSLENSRGRTLRVGGIRLEIGGETTPCERMDEALPGLRNAMRPHWGGGVFAQVLDDGVITVGDSVAGSGLVSSAGTTP